MAFKGNFGSYFCFERKSMIRTVGSRTVGPRSRSGVQFAWNPICQEPVVIEWAFGKLGPGQSGPLAQFTWNRARYISLQLDTILIPSQSKSTLAPRCYIRPRRVILCKCSCSRKRESMIGFVKEVCGNRSSKHQNRPWLFP